MVRVRTISDLAVMAGVVGLASVSADTVLADEVHVHEGESIQAAIEGASAGDVIIVHEGTYIENLVLGGKAVTLRSTEPLNPAVVLTTIIDGGASGTVITCANNEGPDTIINGFVITNGFAASGGGVRNYQADPTVTNCSFSGNSANFGGGMYNDGCSPKVLNCTFLNNSADSDGGGMYNTGQADPTITNCVLGGNRALWSGGGMCNSDGSNPVLTDCAFKFNQAAISGGGVQNYDASNADLTGCEFIANYSPDGAAIHNDLADPVMTGCDFTGNDAENRGGAIYNDESSPSITDSQFIGNAAETDEGGAIYTSAGGNPLLTNCRFGANTPEQVFGPYEDGHGNLFSEHVPPPTPIAPDGACCFETGCLDLPESDCIEAGGVYMGDDTTCDDSNCPEPCLADANADGVVDIEDIFAVLGAWGPCP